MTTSTSRTTEVCPSPSPEWQKAAAELAGLEAQLVDAELRLATLTEELTVFEKQYASVVGRLCEEIDHLSARIASLCADRLRKHDRPLPPHDWFESLDSDSASPCPQVPDFRPTEGLTQLYREAAKRFHPDLAETDSDRVWRTQMMQQVNSAYAAGDSDRLRQMLANHPDTKTTANYTDAVLTALLEKIARVRSRLDEILQNESCLRESDIGRLYAEATSQGVTVTEFLRSLAVSLKTALFEKRAALAALLATEDSNE